MELSDNTLIQGLEGVTEIEMPRAGLTMVEGTIIDWKVAEGDKVEKGQVVMEYENEKTVIEYEILAGGYIHIVAKAQETIKVGKPIAYVTETKEQYEKLAAAANAGVAIQVQKTEDKPEAEPAGKADGKIAEKAQPVEAAKTAAVENRRISATGYAKKIAAENGVDLAQIQPTGGPENRRIVAKDVLDYIEKKKTVEVKPEIPAAVTEDEVTVVPWVGIRKTIAQNMYNSVQMSAQCCGGMSVDATDLLALRKKLADSAEYLGTKITVGDLLCRMMTKVLQKHPYLNSTYDGENVYMHKHVQIGLAIGVESGLIVPVIRNADELSLVELSKKSKELAELAKERKLTPQYLQGATVTISNVGMFPLDTGTPLLNLPQVALFSFGRTLKRPMYMEDGTLAPRMMMAVSCTFDHRVVDGAYVGMANRDIEYYIEHPELILA